jgi:hypothetical protein
MSLTVFMALKVSCAAAPLGNSAIRNALDTVIVLRI